VRVCVMLPDSVLMRGKDLTHVGQGSRAVTATTPAEGNTTRTQRRALSGAWSGSSGGFPGSVLANGMLTVLAGTSTME
jgi:hypothetical protein